VPHHRRILARLTPGRAYGLPVGQDVLAVPSVSTEVVADGGMSQL